jgi:hypothetical protein
MSWKGWVGDVPGTGNPWVFHGFYIQFQSFPNFSVSHPSPASAMVQLQVNDPRTSRLVMESHAEEGSVPQSEIYIWSEFNGFHMVQKCPDVFFGQCFIGKTMMIISCGEVAYFQTNPHVASHVAVEVFQVWTSIQMGLSKIIGVPKIRWFRASSSLFIATNWNKLVGIYIYTYIYMHLGRL